MNKGILLYESMFQKLTSLKSKQQDNIYLWLIRQAQMNKDWLILISLEDLAQETNVSPKTTWGAMQTLENIEAIKFKKAEDNKYIIEVLGRE